MTDNNRFAYLAKITHFEMQPYETETLIDLINKTLAGKRNILNYKNDNQLRQDRAHLIRLADDYSEVLFVRDHGKASIIPLKPMTNRIDQTSYILRTLRDNHSLIVTFMPIEQAV